MIHKQFELSDLVNMAEVSADFYYVALYEFKREYSHLTLAHNELKNASKPKSLIDKVLGYETGEIVVPPYVEKYDERLFVRDYQLLLKTIK